MRSGYSASSAPTASTCAPPNSGPLAPNMSLSVTALARNGVCDGDLRRIHQHLQREFPMVSPVIALWSGSQGCINVVEGSHARELADDAQALAAPVTGVDYEFGNESLLWIDLDTQWSFHTNIQCSEMTAFIPCRNERALERT
jgi:hypothetical protein